MFYMKISSKTKTYIEITKNGETFIFRDSFENNDITPVDFNFDTSNNKEPSIDKIDKREKYNFFYYFYIYFSVFSIVNCVFSLLSYFFAASHTPLMNYILENMNDNWSNPDMLSVNIGIVWVFIYLSLYILNSWILAFVLIIKYRDKKDWWVPVPFLFIGFGIILIGYINYIFKTSRKIRAQLNSLTFILIYIVITIVNILTYLPFVNNNVWTLYISIPILFIINMSAIGYIWSIKWIINGMNSYKNIWMSLSLCILFFAGIIAFASIGINRANKQIKQLDYNVDKNNNNNNNHFIKRHKVK